jgi:hypothetical protein
VAKRSKTATTLKLSNAPEIAFEYIKSNLFRVIHADGAIGGVTPSGNLHLAFFSERPAIPRMIVHKRDPSGTLGPPIPEKTITRAPSASRGERGPFVCKVRDDREYNPISDQAAVATT